MFTACFDIPKKTAKVDKMLKQIKKGIRKIPQAEYKDYMIKCHEAWESARREIIPIDAVVNVSMAEMITVLWNSLDGNEYQTTYCTERTIVNAINSFAGSGKHISDELEYLTHSRNLADAFKRNVGIKTNKLSRLKYTIEQNLIIEGK